MEIRQFWTWFFSRNSGMSEQGLGHLSIDQLFQNPTSLIISPAIQEQLESEIHGAFFVWFVILSSPLSVSCPSPQ
jgi:hypothetical protein